MTEAPQKPNWDYVMLLTVLCLAGLGLVMVFSSSSVLAQKRYGDPYYFLMPQVAYVLAGLLLMFVVKGIPYQLYARLAYVLLFATIVGLILVLIPGVGHRAGGASRWLRIAGLSLQPSEFAKLALVIYLAYSLSSKQENIKRFSYGLLPHLAALGILVSLILAEPDLGTSAMLVLIAMIMFFAAGVRVSYLVGLAALSIPAVYVLIVRNPYRLRRISAFLSPWEDPLDTGYHIIHSFMAFATGGLTGVGPGGGRQKLFYLPEPHTDFIFSVVGEELGFLGVSLVTVLFLILVWRGISAALNSYDLLGSYLALGMTLAIGLQAFMNMGVVIGLLPTKGLTLPFFSYGGSSMLVTFAAIGVIMNVATQKKAK